MRQGPSAPSNSTSGRVARLAALGGARRRSRSAPAPRRTRSASRRRQSPARGLGRGGRAAASSSARPSASTPMSLRAIKLRSPYAGWRRIASPGYSARLLQASAQPGQPLLGRRAVHPVEHVEQIARERGVRVARAIGAVAAVRLGRLGGRDRRRPPRPRSRPRASPGTGPRPPRGADPRGSRRPSRAATPQEIRSPPAARRLCTASVATARASSTVPDGSSTQNSSPPKRPTTASEYLLAAYTSASAAPHSARSPASWPPWSFTRFRSSMSHRTSAGEPGPAGVGARLLERPLDGAAARHAGQRVGVGELLDLGEQLGAVDRAHELVGDGAQEAHVLLRQRAAHPAR